jgi:23S rRNA (uracil1939-C5)-methyltransferase
MALECPHLSACPGCPRFGERELDPGVARRLATLARHFGAELCPPLHGGASGFRMRARLAVRGRRGRLKLGLFEEGTHVVADIPNCVVHHPTVNSVARALKRIGKELGALPYSDLAHAGDVRYLQAVIERSTGRAQVVLSLNSRELERFVPFAEALAEALGPELHSVWLNENAERTNAILGRRFIRVRGEAAVRERLGAVQGDPGRPGVDVFFPPGAFGQANLDLAERMYRRALEWVPLGARVVELYAGVGAMGLQLLSRSDVVLNELGEASLEGLALGLDALDGARRARARVVPGGAGSPEAVAELAAADVVLVDPPRRGLDREVTAALCARPPERLIYLSCGFDAFEREVPLLAEAGLSLRELVPVALFPHTSHVETLALFTRA